MIRLIQRRLIIPRGDTGSFTIPALASATSADIAVFTIFSCLTHSKIFDKIVNVTGDTLNFTFTHSDTVNLPVGEYVWDIKFYKDPIYEDDKLINGTEIDSYYAGYKLPVCEIRETGDNLLVSDDAPQGTLTPNQIDIVNSALATLQVAIAQTQANVEHYPKIENSNWYVWDASAGEYVDTGIAAQGQDGAPGRDGVDGAPGKDGADGAEGAPGKDGKDGVTPSFSIGTISTLQPSASATASITGTAAAPVLNLGIPQGQPAQLTPEIEGLPARVTTIENNYAQQNGTYDNMTVGEAKAIDKEDDLTEIGAYNYRVTAGGTDIGRREQEILEQVVGGTIAWNQMVRDEASPNETDFAEIVTVDDAVEDAAEVQVKIEPVQDLHGYDSPWPAGGGKNLFNIEDIQPFNKNVTVTKTNDTFTVTNNNSYATTAFRMGVYDLSWNLQPGQYTISIGAATSINLYVYASADGASYTWFDNGIIAGQLSKTFTVVAEKPYISIRGQVDTNSSVIISKFQLEAGSTATTYAPYSNICPITGWTGAKVTRTGKNLLEMFGKSGSNMLSKNTFVKTGTYTASVSGISGNYATYVRKATTEGSFSGDIIASKVNQGNITFTLEEDTDLIIQWYTPNDSSADLTGKTFQLELGSTTTAYELYQGETYDITFPSEAGTVYGGELTVNTDGSGSLMVDKATVDLGTLNYSRASGSDSTFVFTSSSFAGKKTGIANIISDCFLTTTITSWTSSKPNNSICGSATSAIVVIRADNYENVNDLKTALNGHHAVYELATPVTYTLTAPEIRTLLGKNNVWADTGDVSLTYTGTNEHLSLESGKKYLARISDTDSIVLGSDQEVVTAKGTDNVFNLTQMFGSTIADYIYNLEATTAGAGVAWFKKLFPKDYYAYNAGELMSVQTSAHKMVEFNAYNSATGEAQLVGGMEYQITGAYTALTFEGETITPDANGKFTPATTGKLTVTGGNSTTTCVHLVWDGERDSEYQLYELHSYPLDDSLVLRGIPKLDASNSLYYDGDTYEPDGTVTRKYTIIDLGTLNWQMNQSLNQRPCFYIMLDNAKQEQSSVPWNAIVTKKYRIVASSYLYTEATTSGIMSINGSKYIQIRDFNYNDASTFKTAMSGVYLVYELATPTTETADPYTNPQLLDPYGTEEFVDCGTRDVAIPVGHKTIYQQQDLQSKLEDLPANPTENGDFVLHHENSTNTYKPLILPPNLSTEVTQNSNNIDEILQDILDYQVFDNYTRRNGSIAVFTGKWANVYNVIFQHAIIPVNKGDTVFIEAPRNTYTVYAQLLNDDAPIQNEDAPLNGDAIQLAAGKTAEFTIDENTHYLYILVRRSYDRTDIITKVTINGTLINRQLQTNINELVNKLANLTTQVNTLLQNIGSLQSNVKYSLENGLQYYDGSTWQSING